MRRINHYRVKRPFWDIEHLSKHKNSLSKYSEKAINCDDQSQGNIKTGCPCTYNNDCISGACGAYGKTSQLTCG